MSALSHISSFPYTTLFRSTIRQFCGTYPLLVTSHAEGGADAVSSFGQALDVQCPLAELDETCAALQEAASGQTPEAQRSEEHTSERQSRGQLVSRLLLEKT